MSEYSILAKLIIDKTALDTQLKSYNPVINIKAKMPDADSLNISMGKMQNQLDAIKIKNADAFKTTNVAKMGSSVQSLITNFDGSKKAAGEFQVAMGSLKNEVTKTNEGFRTTTASTDNFATSMGKVIGKIALWGVATGILYGSLKRIQEGVQFIKDLNQEMTNIGLVSGQTTSQLSGMASQFNSMAKELGATTLDMAEGATTWINI